MKTTIKYILLILIVFTSCKTKHKVIERETVKEETKKEVSINTIEQKDVVTNQDINIGSGTIKINSQSTIKLTQANPDITFTIEDETGKKLKVTGANLDISNNQSKETKKDTLSNKSSTVDKSKNTVSNHTKEETKKDNTKRTSNSDVKTTSTWLWIAIILVVLLGLGYYINKKTNWLV